MHLSAAWRCSAPCCLSAPAAGPEAPFSEPQRQAIGEIVRDYLLKNPEVLTEVIAELEKRQADAQRVSQAGALKETRQTPAQFAAFARRRQPGGRRHPGGVLRLQLRLLQKGALATSAPSSRAIRSCASC